MGQEFDLDDIYKDIKNYPGIETDMQNIVSAEILNRIRRSVGKDSIDMSGLEWMLV